MRLIDADALEQIITEKFQKHYGNTVYQFIHDFFRFVIRQIRKAPTIEAEPVKHGRWVEILGKWRDSDTGKPVILNQCSCCGNYFIHAPYNYCPTCGAKMDGKSCVPRTEDGGAENE